MNEKFADDIREGLSSEPKFLQSKYFYNEKGDKLFQMIMSLEEYYLTGCEHEIFENRKEELLKSFCPDGERFDLIEFGAGDGYKTKVLISYFLECGVDFTYVPIDISNNVLNQLSDSMRVEFGNLKINPICDDYFHALEELNKVDFDKKVILFLGSNIGNFRGDNAIPFLSRISADMKAKDKLLIGFDLKKDPNIILKAYNDARGITREFNLNLLDRINSELEGDFNREKFTHFPTYNPFTGETKSYLISLEDQKVHLKAINQKFEFKKWEPVFMEISQKYSLSDIDHLAERSGFKVETNYFDNRQYFTDSLWILK
jgi:dimethylhistidine N-methyltransferase